MITLNFQSYDLEHTNHNTAIAIKYISIHIISKKYNYT